MPDNVFTQIQISKFKNYDYFSIAGVTMIVINSLAYTCGKTSPPFGGAWGGFFPLVYLSHLDEIGLFWRLEASERRDNYPWRGLYNLTLTPSVRVQNCVKNTYQNIHIIKAITKHALSFYAILQYPPNRDLGFPSFEKQIYSIPKL